MWRENCLLTRLLHSPLFLLYFSLGSHRGFLAFSQGHCSWILLLLSALTPSTSSSTNLKSRPSFSARFSSLQMSTVTASVLPLFSQLHLRARSAASLSSSLILLNDPLPLLIMCLVLDTDPLPSSLPIILSSTPRGRFDGGFLST